MKKHLHKIAWVEPGSIAEELGLEPGDAIEEIKVNVDENPMPPNAMVMIKYNAFPTGKPRNKLYVPKHNKASSTVKMAL